MSLIPQTVTRQVAVTILKTKKNSPHIFFAGGVLGVVTSTVLACRATLKLDKQLDMIKNDIHAAKEVARLAEEDDESTYSEHDYYRDLGHVYIRSAVTVGKLYGPSVVLSIASIAALTGSHVQLTRRNAALTATLASVMQAYDEYRARIREEIGEEREFDIYHNVTEEKDESGKKVKVVNTSQYSMYAKWFDKSNPNWNPSPEHNRIFLQLQQNYANHKLQTHGFLLLNDVYDMLGFNRTTEGCIVGWVYGGEGDDFIDFGLFDGMAAARFINGDEPCIILDFNVDGVIYEQIGS